MASSIDKRAQIYVTYNFADKYPNNPKLIIHSFQFRITDESSKFFSNQSKQLFRKKMIHAIHIILHIISEEN